MSARLPGPQHRDRRRLLVLLCAILIEQEALDGAFGRRAAGAFADAINVLRGQLRLDSDQAPRPSLRAASAAASHHPGPWARFLQQCTVAAPGERVQSSTMHTAFNAWAKANGESSQSAKRLTAALAGLGYQRIHSNFVWWLDVKLMKSAGAPASAGSRRRGAKATRRRSKRSGRG